MAQPAAFEYQAVSTIVCTSRPQGAVAGDVGFIVQVHDKCVPARIDAQI